MKEILSRLDLQPSLKGQILGIKHCYDYRMGSVAGCLIAHKGRLRILFVGNDQIGNGHFRQFVQALEDASERERFVLSVEDFINPRLRDWFIRRGYRYNRKADRVTYIKEQP